eukprot:405471-Amphidinium_carterae.1
MTPKFTDSWHGALHAQHVEALDKKPHDAKVGSHASQHAMGEVTDLAAKTPKSATSSHSDHGG